MTIGFRHEMVLGLAHSSLPDPALPDDQQWQPSCGAPSSSGLATSISPPAPRPFSTPCAVAPPSIAIARRLSLFGLTTMAPLYLKMLLALQRVVELHLFVLEPTEHFWSDIKTRV